MPTNVDQGYKALTDTQAEPPRTKKPRMISNGGPSISAGWDSRRVASPDAFMESANRQLSGQAKSGAIKDLTPSSSTSVLKHTTKLLGEKNGSPPNHNARAFSGLPGAKDRINPTQSTMSRPGPARAIMQDPDPISTSLENKLGWLEGSKDVLTVEQYKGIKQELLKGIDAAKSSVSSEAADSSSLPQAKKPSTVKPTHIESPPYVTFPRVPVQDESTREEARLENPRKRKTVAAGDFPNIPASMNTSRIAEVPVNVRASNDEADVVPSAPAPSSKPASKIPSDATQPIESVPVFTGGRDNIIGEWVYKSHFVPSTQSGPVSTTATVSPSASGAFSPPVMQFRALSLNDPTPLQPKSSNHPTAKASPQLLPNVPDSAVTRQYANADASEGRMQSTSTTAKPGSQRAPSWNVAPYDSMQLPSERLKSKGPTLPAFLSSVAAPMDPGKAARMQYLGISNDESSKPMNVSGQRAARQAAAIPNTVARTSVAVNAKDGQNVSVAPTKAPSLPAFLQNLPRPQDPSSAARAQYGHAPTDMGVNKCTIPELGGSHADSSPTITPAVEDLQSPNNQKPSERLLPPTLEAKPAVNKKDPFARGRKIRV